jgi:hypothetical protein
MVRVRGLTSVFRLFALAALVILPACSHTDPKAYVFAVPKALASEGYYPAMSDPSTGMVVTRWLDTGYRMNEAVDDGSDYTLDTYVYRRYRVSVTGGTAAGVRVHLAVEAKRCIPGAQIRETAIVGTCDDMLDELPSRLTKDLAALATRVQRVAWIYARRW